MNSEKGFNGIITDESKNIIYTKVFSTAEYDKFTLVTTFKLHNDHKESLNLKNGREISIYAIKNDILSFNLVLTSSSKNWRYLDFNSTHFLVSDERFSFPERTFYRKGSVMDGYVFEYMSYSVNDKFLDAILKSKTFEFKLGIDEFKLSEKQIDIIKNFILEVKEKAKQ
jgi:hypothetical protein